MIDKLLKKLKRFLKAEGARSRKKYKKPLASSAKKPKKKRSRRRSAKRYSDAAPKARKKKTAKKKTAKRKTAKRKTAKKKTAKSAKGGSASGGKKSVSRKPVKEKKLGAVVGEVTHYFSKISVVVIKVKAPRLRVGDRIRIIGGTVDFTQKVSSMQIESEDVRQASRGKLVGLKVGKAVRAGAKVYRA